jgi:hypothetical protein
VAEPVNIFSAALFIGKVKQQFQSAIDPVRFLTCDDSVDLSLPVWRLKSCCLAGRKAFEHSNSAIAIGFVGRPMA